MRVALITDFTLDEFLGGAQLVNDYLATWLRLRGLDVQEVAVNERRDDWPRLAALAPDVLLVTNVPFLDGARLQQIASARVPYVMLRHDIASVAYLPEPSSHPAATLVAALFAGARANVMISPVQLHFYQRVCEVPRAVILPPAFDLSAFQPAAPDVAAAQLLCLGGLARDRGVTDTLAYSAAHHPGKSIDFYGTPEDEALAQEIRAAGHRILPTVSRTQMPQVLPRYRTLLYHPRIVDAFSLKVLEAELCGLTVEGRREHIGRYGYDIPAGELAELMRERTPALIHQLLVAAAGQG